MTAIMFLLVCLEKAELFPSGVDASEWSRVPPLVQNQELLPSPLLTLLAFTCVWFVGLFVWMGWVELSRIQSRDSFDTCIHIYNVYLQLQLLSVVENVTGISAFFFHLLPGTLIGFYWLRGRRRRKGLCLHYALSIRSVYIE